MPRSYTDEAIADCQRLYLKFNGQQHDRIEAEMRKTWPGWSRQNLYTRGKGPKQKIGWIDKFGWEKALQLHLTTRVEKLPACEQIFREIDEIRKKIFTQIKVLGAKAERDLIYQHRDYTKLSIDALNKIGAGQTLDSFVAMWERLLDWLPLISPKALAELLKVDNVILEKAALEYGDEEERVGGGKD
jgi:hypothetical protein